MNIAVGPASMLIPDICFPWEMVCMVKKELGSMGYAYEEYMIISGMLITDPTMVEITIKYDL